MEPKIKDLQLSDLNKYLKVNVTLLRIFRLLPLPPNATTRNKIVDIMIALIVPTMISVVVVPNILSLFNDNPDINVFMESLSGLTESGGLQIKYIILLLRRNDLKKLIESCKDLWETNHPRGYEILSLYVKRASLMTRVCLGVFILTATCFAILPFFLRPSDQTLPVSPGYVINSELAYETASGAQCVAIYVSALILVAVDSLLPVMLIISRGQFQLIRVILNDINESYETSVNDLNKIENFEHIFKSNLNECIDRHQRLLLHYTKIEEIFNLYSLVQMFIGLCTIALGLLNLSMGTADAIKYLTILMTGVIQIFICSWSPEKIYQESSMTNLAIYNLPWYRGKISRRITISILLMMTQRPIRITAGKFTILSMQTFSAVLTNAMSFLTVLKSLT